MPWAFPKNTPGGVAGEPRPVGAQPCPNPLVAPVPAGWQLLVGAGCPQGGAAQGEGGGSPSFPSVGAQYPATQVG